MKKPQCLIVILIAFLFAEASWAGGVYQPASSDLRIGCWNVFNVRIYKGNDNSSPGSRYHSWPRIMNGVKADIWLLQEMYYTDSGVPNSYIEDFTAHVRSVTGDNSWNWASDNKGRVTLSRYPIQWSAEVSHRIHATWIQLPASVSSRDLLVINVHFMQLHQSVTARDFIRQVRAGNHHAGIPSDVSIVFAGDFNANYNSTRYNNVRNEGFTDTYPTHNGTNAKETIGDVRMSNGSFDGILGNQIDFVLLNSDVLAKANSFILNTIIMPEADRNAFGLQQRDIAVDAHRTDLNFTNGRTNCDHFPIIVDLKEELPMIPNNSQFVSQSVPSSLDPGQTALVSVTMKNVGLDAWTAAKGHKLGSQPNGSDTWGLARVDLGGGDSIAPNENKTFTFNITAPTTPGVYDFRWRMVDDVEPNQGWFGGLSTNVAIEVGDVPLRIQAQDYTDMSGIGTQPTGDDDGDFNVRSIDVGDWMDYRVNVEKAGTYELSFRVASPSRGANFDFKKGGSVLAVVNAPPTGDWQVYTTVTRQARLEAGAQTFRIEATDRLWNFNWFEILYIGDDPPVNEGSSPAVRFDSPPTAAMLGGGGLHLRVNVFNSENIGQVSLFKNGVKLARTATTAPYEWGGPGQDDPELLNLQPGIHEIKAVVKDTSGNEGEATITVTVLDPDNMPPIHINFQTADAEVPAGYLADTSQIFADRGNGYSYGWTTAFSATRERKSHPDKRFDTLNHTQAQGADRVWEIELPNGDYVVNLTGGDPTHDDSFIEFIAEKGTANEITLASGNATGVNFISGSATVTVSDGRLTIRNGPNAVNNKINFVDIFASSESDPYEVWKSTHGITDDFGDEDNDGIVNLLEFAFGGDPRIPGTAKLPHTSVEGNHLLFTLQRQESVITYMIEKSTDLSHWEDHATVTDDHGVVGGEATVSLPAAEMDDGKLFLRLRVER